MHLGGYRSPIDVDPRRTTCDPQAVTTPDEESAALTRRQLLIRGAGLAGTAGAVSLLGQSAIARAASVLATGALPPPAQSGIKHIVVVMMENRSFDHFLGWLPGADGQQAGLQYVDANGVTHSTAHLTEFQGCGHPDPDHSYEGGRIQYADGACDGFLKGANDEYSIGYYTNDDLPFYGNAAQYWTACDRYFAAIMAATYPNRFYMHGAQTDRLHNGDGTLPTTIPTIWDRLAEAKLSHKYYYSDVPFIALWGDKYLNFAHPFSNFIADCQSGKLPKVSFVDPRFLGEGQGTAGDDHPHSDIRVGQDFLNQVYSAITNSPAWKNTVFVINYDEWGGFFDHVPPGLARDANPLCRLRGFRVPALVISPFARRNHVAHHVYDHTSILKMIEWRWGLQPLTVRDAHARNLAEVLDFAHPNLHAPSWDVPPGVGDACPAVDPSEFTDWFAIRDQAVRAGFALA
jgi:phospholipase C